MKLANSILLLRECLDVALGNLIWFEYLCTIWNFNSNIFVLSVIILRFEIFFSLLSLIIATSGSWSIVKRRSLQSMVRNHVCLSDQATYKASPLKGEKPNLAITENLDSVQLIGQPFSHHLCFWPILAMFLCDKISVIFKLNFRA